MKKIITTALLILGYVSLASGTLMAVIDLFSNSYVPFGFYVVGVVLIAVYRVLVVKRDGNFRVKRLNTLEATGTLLLIASAYCFYEEKNIWVLLLLLAVSIDVVITFRYPSDAQNK